MEPSKATLEEAISRAFEDNLSLNLNREAMAFLVGIYIFGKRRNDNALSESDIKELFKYIDTLAVTGEPETLDRRANNEINRLKEQGLLFRMEQTYVLTDMGRSIGQQWEITEIESQRNLVHYTLELTLLLDRVLQAATTGGDDQHWEDKVEIPLRETISELVHSIDRRQQGMAKAQQRIRSEIANRISEEWLAGIEACEGMLKTTGSALEELHTIILREADNVQHLLESISEYAMESQRTETIEAVEKVQNQMEVVRQWADHSFQEWSGYFKHVHDYIRIRVRTDPNRHLPGRIKKAIDFYPNRPWTFAVPSPAPYLHLREEGFEKPIEEVAITGKVNRPEIDRAPQEQEDTMMIALKEKVDEVLERDGRANLVDILAEVMPVLSLAEAFRIAGNLVSLLAKAGVARSLSDRSWKEIERGCEVQDLTVYKRKEVIGE